jgi:hypothetical protein
LSTFAVKKLPRLNGAEFAASSANNFNTMSYEYAKNQNTLFLSIAGIPYISIIKNSILRNKKLTNSDLMSKHGACFYKKEVQKILCAGG